MTTPKTVTLTVKDIPVSAIDALLDWAIEQGYSGKSRSAVVRAAVVEMARQMRAK